MKAVGDSALHSIGERKGQLIESVVGGARKTKNKKPNGSTDMRRQRVIQTEYEMSGSLNDCDLSLFYSVCVNIDLSVAENCHPKMADIQHPLKILRV